MQSPDSNSLLRQYVETGSEEAFAALVAQHVNLVYSVALRHVAQPQLAEEITQAVFLVLARKARELRHEKALASWLFQTTRLTAKNFLRSELRRQRREQEAYMQSVIEESSSELWQRLAPTLDAAVGGLGEKDRRAILLRYYEGRDLRQVGAALGASDAAAEKRVARALEKLRKLLLKQGVSSAAAVLATAMSANAVQPAPAALAPAIAAMAIGKGAVASSFTLELVNGALNTTKIAKAKTVITLTSAAALCVAGTMVAAWAQHAPAELSAKGVVSSSTSGSTRSGRHVHAVGDDSLGIEVAGETVTVKLGEPHLDVTGSKLTVDHTLTVEKERLLVDGKPRAKLAPSAGAIEVEYMKHKLSVTADKKLVLAVKLNG